MAKSGNARASKTTGGVKLLDSIPGADWINGALHAPLVREAVAAALIAGAAAAAGVLAKSNTRAGKVMRAGADVVADEGREAGDTARELTQAAVGTVLGLAANAAQSFLPSPKPRRGSVASLSSDAGGKAKPRAASPATKPKAEAGESKPKPSAGSSMRKSGSAKKRKA